MIGTGNFFEGSDKAGIAVKLSNNSGGGPSDVLRAVRSANLIANHAQFFALRTKTQNREKEILATGCINPRHPENEVGHLGLANGQFPGKFGLAVGVERVWGVGLYVRFAFRAIENVIGRVVDQNRTDLMGFVGKNSGSRCVDGVGDGGFGFCLIDDGVGCSIDDQLRTDVTNDAANLLDIAEIQILAI